MSFTVYLNRTVQVKSVYPTGYNKIFPYLDELNSNNTQETQPHPGRKMTFLTESPSTSAYMHSLCGCRMDCLQNS